MITYSIDNFMNVIRLIVGLILMSIALQAFFKTRIPAMLYLSAGFFLLTVGDLFSAIYYFDNMPMNDLLSDVFDIIGMILLIIAIRKS